MVTESEFTPNSLIAALTTLFKDNNYQVEGPLKINGAEVDLRAKSKSDTFAPNIYIEATVEYVTNEKYGKDATKFLLIREREPNATLLCVSSSGFSLPVKERASASRVETYTYAELFARFQSFGEYTEMTLGDTEVGRELTALDAIYEEASFVDTLGTDVATIFLSEWRLVEKPSNPWIVIAGDYGTGKTALTKVLLRRWIRDYQHNPSLPIPFRIELKDFTRQFDARGLLHHFLDSNGLGHVSVDFVLSLIRQGRVVLLLDGYDEMAQYMTPRERRTCLAALAELSKGGAKGILTSRPNYFTETEELKLLDALYDSLAGEAQLSGVGRKVLEQEEALDKLLKAQFLERYERFLKDLDDEQTKNLVRKSLAQDRVGQEVILRVLEMTFRRTDEGAEVSLSGKPVIITYMLEVVEELKADQTAGIMRSRLTEWGVYDLIVEKLMWRDFKRTPELLPDARRSFLQRLSLYLSSTRTAAVEEAQFMELINKEFQARLRGVPSESRGQEVQKLFDDLRSSATLTRRANLNKGGWRFSHNSLREFLATDYLTKRLLARDIKVLRCEVSDAMKLFVLSLPNEEYERLLSALREVCTSVAAGEVTAMYISLMWDAGLRFFQAHADPVAALLGYIYGASVTLKDMPLKRLSFCHNGVGANVARINFLNSTLTDIDFRGCNLTGATFSDSILEGVSFKGADLSGVIFKGAMLIDVDFSNSNLRGTSFRGLTDYSNIRTDRGVYNGEEALGYFAFNGGLIDKISPIAICQHHPHHLIAEKIARKLSEQRARQRLGLEKKGIAATNPAVAREFVRYLISHELVEEDTQRDQVRPTEKGRPILKAFCDSERLDPSLYEFFGIRSA